MFTTYEALAKTPLIVRIRHNINVNIVLQKFMRDIHATFLPLP